MKKLLLIALLIFGCSSIGGKIGAIGGRIAAKQGVRAAEKSVRIAEEMQNLLKEILSEISVVDKEQNLQGRRLSLILSPK